MRCITFIFILFDTIRYIYTEYKFHLLIKLLSYFVVDCKWNDFGEWTECSKTCGKGKQERTRTVMTQTQGGGKQCTGSTEETRDCKIKDCSGMQ